MLPKRTGNRETSTDEPLDAAGRYLRTMDRLRASFSSSLGNRGAGAEIIAGRAHAVDELIRTVWADCSAHQTSAGEIGLVAVGGYGRGELFPSSDVDLLFLTAGKTLNKAQNASIRTMTQALWDTGLRVAPMTRTLGECDRFNPENVEFTLALLDARVLTGEPSAAGLASVVSRLIARERRKIVTRLLDVTRLRHAKYGDTLFHLEPNIKDCPGGLRDANVCAWLATLLSEESEADAQFEEARSFLQLTRAFLHLRHRRDDNTLDWNSQDEAAEAGLGLAFEGSRKVEPGYWMRIYFRQARAVERRTRQALEDAGKSANGKQRTQLSKLGRFRASDVDTGFTLHDDRIALAADLAGADPAHDPESVFSMFAVMARTGARLTRETEQRLEQGLPLLSLQLEDGPVLWRRLSEVLTGRFAGSALRTMHALGLLELVLPEFHGIDALVVRDAYHRYTVDEHTFVLIDVLHGLADTDAMGAGKRRARGGSAGRDQQERLRGSVDPWADRFRTVLRDLPHPALLYMAALLHDTGKARAGMAHAAESERLAAGFFKRLEADPYESTLVLNLIRSHLEMSAAMRRDVFDRETISALAAQVESPEALRMLTLFTYADICAVHPDALTPWKAENLWHLYLATVSYLDRNVDDHKVQDSPDNGGGEVLHRVHALLSGKKAEVQQFLRGFPQRYLATRGAEVIAAHFGMAAHLAGPEDVQLTLEYAPAMSMLTLVTRDRPRLFAAVAGALAAWGMNIATAEGFSNADGIVVDSFRFTDIFRTLELNQEERERFVASVRSVIAGSVDVEKLLASRRRSRRSSPRREVATRVQFDHAASTQSSVLEVVAQDTPGLLHRLALTLAQHACNIEVALVDTEGEMAIDVFYVTCAGSKLDSATEQQVSSSLLEGIADNARQGTRP